MQVTEFKLSARSFRTPSWLPGGGITNAYGLLLTWHKGEIGRTVCSLLTEMQNKGYDPPPKILLWQ